jgi:hypothetical protein
MRTVVFSWQQQCSNMPQSATANYWGLGDALRGMIATYQFCKANRLRFVVDIHKHPASSLLTYPATTEFSDTLDKEDVLFCHDFNTILHSKKDPYFLFTNKWCTTPIDEDIKKLIQQILTVKPEYAIALPPAGYRVFHFRLGDQSMRGKIMQSGSALDILKKMAKPGDVVCSDSCFFKQEVKLSLLHLNVYDEMVPAGHVGYETDTTKLITTLHDMQLIIGATEVVSKSVYSWPSGFVTWICECFNKRLVVLKQ